MPVGVATNYLLVVVCFVTYLQCLFLYLQASTITQRRSRYTSVVLTIYLTVVWVRLFLRYDGQVLSWWWHGHIHCLRMFLGRNASQIKELKWIGEQGSCVVGFTKY